jgi:hypothetical protein
MIMNHLDFLGKFEKGQHALVATVQTREREREKFVGKDLESTNKQARGKWPRFEISIFISTLSVIGITSATNSSDFNLRGMDIYI